MLNRRALLAGVSAGAIVAHPAGIKAQTLIPFSQGNSDGVTDLRQARFSAGGYLEAFNGSDDGLTRCITYDSGGGWLLNPAGTEWLPLTASTRLPAGFQQWNVPTSKPRLDVVAPSPSLSTRIYGIFGINGVQYIWRTNDRGDNWTDTGHTTTFQHSVPRNLGGPPFVVDPNNPDVVYNINATGSVRRSLDGMVTFSVVASAPVVASIMNGSIVFDRSSGTTLLGGVTVTARIYISFFGAGTIYRSEDGGATWAAIPGAPANGACWMDCTPDGVLFLAQAAATVTARPTTGAWRWVGATAPGGSGLAINTWTNFVSAAMTSAVGNQWKVVSCDPINLGRVAFAYESGGIQLTNDYGATFWAAASNPFLNPRIATDVPWVANTTENWATNGAIYFDRQISGRLWIVEGIGCFYGAPTPNGGGAAPFWQVTSLNSMQQGLICTDIVKPPGAPLLVSCQDRTVFQLPDLEVEPNSQVFAGGAPINPGWSVDYAISDPTFCIAVLQGYVWKSPTGAPLDWTNASTSLFIGQGAGGKCFAQTPTNFMWFPSNNGSPTFTKDAGANWDVSLFDGVTVTSSGGASASSSGMGPVSTSDTTIGFIDNGAGGGAYSGVAGNKLTLTQAPTRPMYVGATLWRGWEIDNPVTLNATIVSQDSGTPGGIGVYTVSGAAQATSPRVITGRYNVLKVAGVTGAFGVGETLSGASVAVGTIIRAQLDGTPGGAGRYYVTPDFYAFEWGYSILIQGKIGCADLNDGSYICYNYGSTVFGGIWKSVDGGETYQWQGAASVGALGAGTPGLGQAIKSVPGHAGHFMCGFGIDYISGGLRWSRDAGATWINVPNVYRCWQVALGKKAPWGVYPAVFFDGILTPGGVPGMFRSDNFDPNNPTASPRWIRLTDAVTGAPAGNMDAPLALCADYDTHGWVYQAESATGIVYGRHTA
jgi:hypothetical protein